MKNHYAIAVVAAGLLWILPGCQTAPVDHNNPTLAQIVAERPNADKLRDQYRHPQQTLEFFGIEPGMTVLEVLPGGGWYSQIIARYLGPRGTLHAVNYADEMWPLFGRFDDEFIAQRKLQMQDWGETVAQYSGNAERARGFAFGRIDTSLNESIDAVLFIRALHNLNRFEQRAGARSAALAEVYSLLKPDGIVGVVQHQAPADADDVWAAGQNGYLKRDAVIAMFEQAGFELVASSAINENPKDNPGVNDFVWRLPPSMRGSSEDPAAQAAAKGIGESNRMTLKFKKPR